MEHLVLIEGRIHAIIGNMSNAPESLTDGKQIEMDNFILNEVAKRTIKVKAPPPLCPTCRWSGPEALQLFIASREQTMQLLAAPLLRGRVMPHPFFGPWDGYQWLLAVGIAQRTAHRTNPRNESRPEFSHFTPPFRHAMRYMMLIYSQEDEAATPEEMSVVAAGHKALMDQARDRGVFRAADPLEASSHCHYCSGAGWQGPGHRRSIRRNQGAASRILHPRLSRISTKLLPGRPKFPPRVPARPDVSRSGPSANFPSVYL